MMSPLDIHQAAATLAAAVVSKVNVQLAPPTVGGDGTVKVGDDAKALNLLAWELHRIFYSAVAQTLGDPKDWPPPPAGAAPDLSGLVSQLPGLIQQLGGTGALAGLLTKLPGLIGSAPSVTPASPSVVPPSTVPTAPASGS